MALYAVLGQTKAVIGRLLMTRNDRINNKINNRIMAT